MVTRETLWKAIQPENVMLFDFSNQTVEYDWSMFDRVIQNKSDVNAVFSEGGESVLFSVVSGVLWQKVNDLLDQADSEFMKMHSIPNNTAEYHSFRQSITESAYVIKVIEKLLVHGIDVNFKDAHGNTPLMLAIPEDFEVTKYLVEAGADVCAVNHQGVSVSDITQQLMWEEETVSFIEREIVKKRQAELDSVVDIDADAPIEEAGIVTL